MNKKIFSLHSILLAALSSLILLSACSKDEDEPSKANVMVIHASADAPGVDLLVDNNKVNTQALTFPNSTGYLAVNAGTRNIKVNASGTSTTVINADLTLAENKNYSVFAANTLSSIEAVVLEDNLATPAAGKAHVRVVHLSPDAPAVNIGVQGLATNLFTNLAFKSGTAFTPVDAGTYNLEVKLASNNAVVLTIPATLAAGKIYTVFARGFVTPPAGNTNSLGVSVIMNN